MNKILSSIVLSCFALSSLFAQSSSIERQIRDALLALREQRYEDSVALASDVQRVLDRNNRSSYLEVTLTKIRALMQLHRHQEALNEALSLIGDAHQEPRLVQLLGEIYYNMGDGARALPYFADYIAYSPTGDAVGRTYYYMGEIYLLQGRYQRAEIAFTTAVYHNPTSDRWWFRLGYAREQVATTVSGSERTFALTSARNAYERVLQINPSQNEAKERLTIIQRSLR